MDELKKFSIDDIQEVATEDSVEFAIAKIAVLSTRPNSHKINITEEILRRDGQSVLGKWVVAKYDKWTNDVTTHLPDETIVGIVPKDATLTFETTEDGYVVMYVDAIISKIYATDVYKLFAENNARNVSVEMSTYNDLVLSNGTTDIDGLCIYGITILGTKVNGSCPDASMKIIQFSEKQATEFYDKANAFNKIKSMANDLIEFANAQLELETASKEESMEKDREFSEQPKDEDIVMEEPNQQEVDDTEAIKGDDKVDEVEGNEKEMSEDSQVEEEPQTEEKEMAENGEEDKTEEEKEMSCEDNKELSEEATEEMTCGNDKEMSENEELMTEEKSFAEQAVEFAEEGHKDFVEKLFSSNVEEMVKEVVELKQFMETTVKANTEKRFAEIMVEPKLCLGEKAYNVLFEEGSQLSFSELDAFEQKVKAFCEDAPKKSQENEEMLTFSGDVIDNKIRTELSVEELIQKYN